MPHPRRRRAPHLILTSALCAAFAGVGCHGPVETSFPFVGNDSPQPGTPETGTGGLAGPLVASAPLGPQAHRLPISGGTLLVSSDGVTVVAADPDLDLLGVVDVPSLAQIATITLQPGDEPGRLAEDAAGRVHVALRRGGAVVTVDPRSGTILDRRPVCAAPRGIVYDPATDVVHVACAGGELVTLPAAGGAATRTLHLQRDLRDVVIDGGQLVVSLFRVAEVLTLDAAGNVVGGRLPLPFQTKVHSFEPDVAWRLTAVPGGGVLMAHQRAQVDAVPIEGNGGYITSGCEGGVVHSAVTLFATGVSPTTPVPILGGATLPVDVAVSADGASVAIVAAGSNVVFTGALADLTGPSAVADCTTFQPSSFDAVPVAAAYDAAGDVIVQTQGPSVWIGSREVPLFGAAATPAEATVGFDTFHQAPGGFGSVSCASCHPEGREDGRVWLFDTLGQRRTQALAGDITDTAPFHWGGDLVSVGDVMSEVFVHRMGGSDSDLLHRTKGVTAWLATIPAPPLSPPTDPASVARGTALFVDPTVGCAGCHSGPKHTNNQTVDVGTGLAVQVPWLIGVAWRAPYLHDGCAATLSDRFGPCGGDKHGNTASLDQGQIADLVSFLETL